MLLSLEYDKKSNKRLLERCNCIFKLFANTQKKQKLAEKYIFPFSTMHTMLPKIFINKNGQVESELCKFTLYNEHTITFSYCKTGLKD